MSHRLSQLNQRLHAGRHLLGWFGVLAASTVLAAITVTDARAAEATPAQDTLMLRPGDWGQEHGGYQLPTALQADPRQWPATGWYRVTHKADVLDVQAVAEPGRGLPPFLRQIAAQVLSPDAALPRSGEEEAEAVDTRYIRVTGKPLAQGRLPVVKFARGVLTPRLDHSYQLALGDRPFTLTVQNGLRNKAGVAYGEGAVYTVTTADGSYSYHLAQGYGWDTQILAAADLDGDQRPDFIVRQGDSEQLLLSTQAGAGLNPPAATLAYQASGC